MMPIRVNDYSDPCYAWADDLYAMLEAGAEVETNCKDLAQGMAELFPNSVIHYKPKGPKRKCKKRKKRRK